MKLINKYMLFVFLLCVVASCQEKEPDDDQGKIEQIPIFPEKIVDDKVAAGQNLALTFTPNLDWELSVNREASQFFKLIAANGRQSDKVSGKASEEPVTVSIWVNPLEEYGTNRSCTVTMSMGGKSQVVAEYMRPAKQKTMSVYVAKIENGEYVKDDAGNYVYQETEAQDLPLIWSAEEAAFLLPVKFEANCQWDIDRISFPEWLQLQVPEKTEGIQHLVFTGVSFDATEGEVSFISGDTALKKLNVSIPSCSGLDLYYAKSEEGEWVYGEEGYEYSEDPHESIDMVWTGSDFRLPVKVDSKCEWTVSCPEWASVEFEENDNKRSGIDRLTIKGNPVLYPEDDASAKISFSFKGKLLKEIQLNISGCRNIITCSFGMSITQPEFNFAGQYKTTAGFMDAPLSGTVMSLASMSHRAVEIKDGRFVETAPQWLTYDIFQDQDTDTRVKLQNRKITIEVEPTEEPSDREAYIFMLPLPVSEVASLFEEDGYSVKEEYKAYCIPVIQTGKPADYLTPEFSVEDMEEGGASIVRSSDNGLYEDAIFGATDYAYEMVYKNMWSGESANVYLTYPYETIDFYDADKNKITDTDKFWLAFKDYQEDKSYGTFEIRTDTENYESVAAFAVFKDAEGKSLCVVKISYVPEIPEEPQEPEIPAGQGNILLEDASHYFADPQTASEAGATLELITGIYIPVKPITVAEPVNPGDGASEEELTKYQQELEAWIQYTNQLAAYTAYEQLTSYQKAHLQSLSKHFKDCSGVKAPLLKLTYKSANTKLRLDSEELRSGDASQFSVNPNIASDYVKINNKLMGSVGGKLSDLAEGRPRFEMIPIDFEPGSSRDIEMQSTALVVLFYDDDSKILLGVYCELDI